MLKVLNIVWFLDDGAEKNIRPVHRAAWDSAVFLPKNPAQTTKSPNVFVC